MWLGVFVGSVEVGVVGGGGEKGEGIGGGGVGVVLGIGFGVAVKGNGVLPQKVELFTFVI